MFFRPMDDAPIRSRLDGEQVAVAAGVVQHGLDADLLLDLDAQALRAHAGAGAGRVGDVDGVDAELVQQCRALDLFCAVDALGRNDLHQRAELAGGDQRADPGTLGEWQRLDLADDGFGAVAWPSGLHGGLGVCLQRALACGGGFVSSRAQSGRVPPGRVLLRLQGAHRRLHGADVVGRGSATAADEACAGVDELAREAGHVLRRGHVDVAALDGAGQSGVGHGGQRQAGRQTHPLDDREHGGGAVRAVAANDVRAPLGQSLGGDLGGGAVEAVAVLIHRHHHYDAQAGSDLAGGANGLARLGQRGHGFDDEKVRAHAGPALGQRGDLFGEGCAGLVEREFSLRRQRNAERADGPGDEGLGGLLLGNLRDALAGDADSGEVDLAHPVAEAMALQAEGVCAEGVGLDDLRAGLQVLGVDTGDGLRLREVQLIEAAVDEDSAVIEHGAHGTVGEHASAGEEPVKDRSSRASLRAVFFAGLRAVFRVCRRGLCRTRPRTCHGMSPKHVP